MIERDIGPILRQRLNEAPAVALTGPRQVGKTTLALKHAATAEAVYLDLESAVDRAKLAEPELFLAGNLGRLVILDEVQRVPGLFPVLRGLIDQGRREGQKTGLYLLLRSASLDLLRQSGETLAGRISHLELTPFTALETVDVVAADVLWVRGGFPESCLALDDGVSLRWREDFIRTYLERDIPQLGPRVASETLRRFWTMLAHHQGGLLNVSQLARNIGVDGRTAAGYVDLLVDLLLVRRLAPYHANVGKRLVKSPKVYVRDSGIVHALLGIADREALLSHPVVGASWEGFVIENLIVAAGPRVTPWFYRTRRGAELDLLLEWPNGGRWAIEVKRSLDPRPERGFHHACEDVQPTERFVVYPGAETYLTSGGVTAIPLLELARRVRALQL
ncbi:MAG: ATP-binding protein [Gemmatimonadota bacterium]